MPVRKSVAEAIVVHGERGHWLDKCATAMTAQGFKQVHTSDTLYQVRGNWRPVIGTLYGEIEVTLLPEGDGKTRLEIKATGAVDNIYALFGSPGKRLIAKFKSRIE